MENGMKRVLYDLFGNPWEEYEQSLGWWEAQLGALGEDQEEVAAWEEGMEGAKVEGEAVKGLESKCKELKEFNDHWIIG